MRFTAALLFVAFGAVSFALPLRRVSHYTHRVWTQAQGLPQDTIRAITQTSDGYLWVGTDEGLARFDGYRFSVFGKREDQLPSAGVAALCPSADGSLWIATAGGVTLYKNGVFKTFGAEAGFESDWLITDIKEGPDGSLWVATGLHLARLRDGRFQIYRASSGSGIQGIRVVLPEENGAVWVAGYGSVGRLDGKEIERFAVGGPLGGNIATGLARGRGGTLLVSGSEGLFEFSTAGVTKYAAAAGLADPFVRSFLYDRDGYLWVGTNSGLVRRENNRFVDFNRETLYQHEWVWCIFEDRDGNLWVGANSGLHQFLDQQFAVHTRSTGLPSDQPVAVREDSSGRVWVGFHDEGVGYFDRDRFIPVPGLPSREVFSIRNTASGDLLIGTRGGVSRVHGGGVRGIHMEADELARRNVFDAMEDSHGNVWLGTNRGALVLEPGKPVRTVIRGGVLLTDAVVALLETRDGSVWAGTYGRGLWRIMPDGRQRLYTTQDGLPVNAIRTLHEDTEGFLWAGTFNGGAACLRHDRFIAIGIQQGLPSDIVARILEDKSGNFWFATARGLAQAPRSDVEQMLDGRASSLRATTYGVAEGLRSAQCAPGYPIGTGGIVTADGRLWFPTGFGLAVFDPKARPPSRSSPPATLFQVLVDGQPADLSRPLALPAETQRVEFHYTAVELSAPESLEYRYHLDGFDTDWVQAGNRRSAEYSRLPSGSYVFRVTASLGPNSPAGDVAVFSFARQPHFWEKPWVRGVAGVLAIGLVFAIYRGRLTQVQHAFALVLEERARIAREVHDTLAQGFVGIVSQLDAVAMVLRDRPDTAARHLELARRMSQHSLTEARRSIFDLRGESREDGDLSAAIRSAVRFVTAGKPVAVHYDIELNGCVLSPQIEHQVLRIAQEAVANAAKHASATIIRVTLHCSEGELRMTIEDDGRGFDASQAFVSTGGHFGLLGMQERADRLGGSFSLETAPEQGTKIKVTAPLA